MTFYEAALRVLESEGRPLHFLEITEKSIQLSLLSHIGKTPEVTMLSRLAAMARRTRDRKVIVTAKDTFALTDWSLSEDAEALAQTGVMEPHPEEELPPLRPVERHPEPRTDNVRASGRGTERKRRRDEGDEERGRRKRFPPLPEVVFEILSEAEVGLRTDQLIERARSKELCAEETTVEAVLTALLEDNQRRIDAGRRPQYAFNQETGEVSLERAGAPSEAPPLELQAAFAQALGIPLEGGRPVLGKTVAGVEPLVDEALITTARTALKDARRAVARGLRKRLGDADVGTFEKSVVKMMHGLGFRELKVAKRSKEGPLLTARKREGSVELRYAVRMLKGTPGVDRKTVQELRRDLGHYSAQVGLLVSAGEVRGDARSEAQATGSLVMLWCGDALGEKFLEARTAVNVTQVELYDIDERFFEAAKLDAEEAQRRREERKSEKQAREEGGEVEVSATATTPAADRPEREERPERGDRQERAERRRDRQRARNEARDAAAAQGGAAETPEPKAAPVAAAPPAAAGFTPASSEEDDSDEGDDEDGDEDLEAASAFVGGGKDGAEGGSAEASASERKRRRRRRRGRRGRGTRGAEGTPAGEAGAPGSTGEAVAASGEIAAPSAGGSVGGEGLVALAGEALPVVADAAAGSSHGEAAVSAPSEGNAWQAGEAVKAEPTPESADVARARAEAAQAASDAVTPGASPALTPADEASGEASATPVAEAAAAPSEPVEIREAREVHESPVSSEPGTPPEGKEG